MRDTTWLIWLVSSRNTSFEMRAPCPLPLLTAIAVLLRLRFTVRLKPDTTSSRQRGGHRLDELPHAQHQHDPFAQSRHAFEIVAAQPADRLLWRADRRLADADELARLVGQQADATALVLHDQQAAAQRDHGAFE